MQRKFILKGVTIILSMSAITLLVCIIFRYTRAEHARRYPKNTNILLITVDTQRADHLHCYGNKKVKTPNIDKIASHGTLFSTAICQAPLTLPSHCSIMCGTYPFSHGVRNNGYYYLDSSKVTLAEILRSYGYSTAAFVSAYVLDSKFGLNQGFEIYDDNFSEPLYLKTNKEKMLLYKQLNPEDAEIVRWNKEEMRQEFQRRANEVTYVAIQWLISNHERKFFIWIHYFDPHTPYDPPPPYNTMYRDIYKDIINSYTGEARERASTFYKTISLYDGEVSFVDYHIGQLLKELGRLGLTSRTLIILTADHGESLGEHDYFFDHGKFLYDPSLKVPLIIKYPPLIPRNKVVNTQVRTIDIFPTILDLLDIPLPVNIQGRSLLPLIFDKEEIHLSAYSETRHFEKNLRIINELEAIRIQEWKFIKHKRFARHGAQRRLLSFTTELYNLVRDSGEKVNVVNQWNEMESLLDNMKESGITNDSTHSYKLELDQEARRRLRSLGYLE